jgi:hypothetical protein
MVEKTVTLDLDPTLVASVEAYAAQHNTSLRELVIEYLQALVTTDRPTPEATPILQRLTGILPSSVSENAYFEYIVEKHES